MKKSLLSLLLLFSIVLCSYTNASASQTGVQGSSRPITGGGYEYYDANGNLLYVDRPITGGGYERTSR